MSIQGMAAPARCGGAQEFRTMRTLSRIGMIAVMSVGVIGSEAITWARQPAENVHALAAPSGGPEFSIKNAAGHYLAIHFLTRTDTPECTAFAREYMLKAPTVAGIRHIFVKPDDAAAVKAWAAQFGDEAKA